MFLGLIFPAPSPTNRLLLKARPDLVSIYPNTDSDFVGYTSGPSRIQKRYCAAPLRAPSKISTESKSTTDWSEASEDQTT